MAPRKTRRPGQGFSLYDLQDDIASVVETLADALSRQGVPVDRDSLLLSIQSVVKSIGVGVSSQVDYGYPSLASDDEVPYSVAGDLLCIAHEHFQQGEKQLAVKNMLTAMASEDFVQIAQGLLEMNRLAEKSNKEVFANDEDDSEDEDEDEDEGNTDEDSPNDEDDDNSDLSDEEIDELVEDSERDVTADDEETNNEDKDKDNSVSDEEEDNETVDKDEVDNKENSTEEPKKMEASHTSRVLANRLSLEGHSEGRKRAQEFMRKHGRL